MIKKAQPGEAGIGCMGAVIRRRSIFMAEEKHDENGADVQAKPKAKGGKKKLMINWRTG